MNIEVKLGDITQETTDAIVNAANSDLSGGGGVDGAIHRAAGQELIQACKAIGGCHTGQAVLTSGFDLTADWVIHAVGPIWHGGSLNEAALLASCYSESLKIATRQNLNSIAFPSISTGTYGYPVNLAAKIAIETILSHDKLELIRIVAFDQATFDTFASTLNEMRYVGTWINQNGSTLEIKNTTPTSFSGSFRSNRGRVDNAQEYSVNGLINGNVVSFSVDFGSARSITSFGGKLTKDGRLSFLWVLARSYSDAAQTTETEEWNSFLVNSDIFTKQS